MAIPGTLVQGALGGVGAIGRQLQSFDALGAGAFDALRSAGPGLTPQGAASFLATQAQESDYFRATEEYAKNGRYAPYIGRTFEMITWQGNYAQFGAWCKARDLVPDANVFVNNPAALADFRWAWLGGMWYFEANGLWKYANAGLHLAVSQAVNGGKGTVGTTFVPRGWDARLKMYNAFLALGDALLPGSPPPAGPGPDSLPSLQYGMKGDARVASLQRFCNLFNWVPALPILPVTGNYLDQTADVLRRAALQMGITNADGRNIGPQYKAALWQRGWRG